MAQIVVHTEEKTPILVTALTIPATTTTTTTATTINTMSVYCSYYCYCPLNPKPQTLNPKPSSSFLMIL